ncbi:Sulfur carrier protein TusA [Buchnera aphidicola (Thelaxes suberi)]|uniref:sulfurtransferase TusA family protein n=1 Tax=Buchnera aphidicola TaxID=9 RepID=UPI003463C37F
MNNNKNFINYTIFLNLISLKCPMPIIKLKFVLRAMKKKEKLLVLSDDIYSKREILFFCNCMDYKIIYLLEKNNFLQYLIKK